MKKIKSIILYLFVTINLIGSNKIFAQIYTKDAILLKDLLINVNRDESRAWPFTAATYLGATTVVVSEAQLINAIQKDSLNIRLHQEIIDGGMYGEGGYFQDFANKGIEKNLTMTSGFTMFYLDNVNVIQIGKSLYVFVKVRYRYDNMNMKQIFNGGSYNQDVVEVFRTFLSFEAIQSRIIRQKVKRKYELESYK